MPFAAVAAAALVAAAFFLPEVLAAFPLLFGLVACAVAYRFGYRYSFVTYAISAWCMAAVSLSIARGLDTPLSAAFSDASYVGAALALVVAAVKKS